MNTPYNLLLAHGAEYGLPGMPRRLRAYLVQHRYACMTWLLIDDVGRDALWVTPSGAIALTDGMDNNALVLRVEPLYWQKAGYEPEIATTSDLYLLDTSNVTEVDPFAAPLPKSLGGGSPFTQEPPAWVLDAMRTNEDDLDLDVWGDALQ